jgi:dipeptidyl aminopeptidase/acylaminoacyl peptidase
MRNFAYWTAPLIFLVGCDADQKSQIESSPSSEIAPGLELQPESYAKTRAAFKTKLIKRGPSPQPSQGVVIPAGARVIEYASGDLKLKAFIDPVPDDGVKRPAVLFLHGGFAFGGSDWMMPQPYRDAGFLVMIPLLRGENGQDGDFTLYCDEVDDVLAAADTLAALPYVDPSRVFVSGHSAGGTLSMFAAMTSNKLRAAASLDGSPDQVANLKENPWLGVFDVASVHEVRMRSPVAFATSFVCPTRIYFGDQSDWAHEGSKRMEFLAKRNGLDVEAVEVPGDHSGMVPGAIEQSIKFFQKFR